MPCLPKPCRRSRPWKTKRASQKPVRPRRTCCSLSIPVKGGGGGSRKPRSVQPPMRPNTPSFCKSWRLHSFLSGAGEWGGGQKNRGGSGEWERGTAGEDGGKGGYTATKNSASPPYLIHRHRTRA